MNKEPSIRVAVDIPFSLMEKLDEYCKNMHLKRSQGIRSILGQFFGDKKNG